MLIEMDDSITLQQQMMTEAGPVILINQSDVKASNQLALAPYCFSRLRFIVSRPC